MLAAFITIIIITVVLITPLGISGRYDEGKFFLFARAGPLRITVLPKRDRDNKKEKKKSGKKKKKKTDEKEKKPDNKNRIRTLIKIIPKTLGRLKQKLSIDVLKIYWTAAAEDPFDAAMQFGRVSEIEGIIAPFADKYLKVGTWDLKTNINFAISKPVIYVEFKATYQVWEILYIAGAFVTEYLIMISKLRREHAETERKNENG